MDVPDCNVCAGSTGVSDAAVLRRPSRSYWAYWPPLPARPSIMACPQSVNWPLRGGKVRDRHELALLRLGPQRRRVTFKP